jgi:membrane-associated phospholipid phosphatase
VRHFGSIEAAANEAGESRVYGGIHYPSGVTVGKTVGECVAGKVLARLGPAVRIEHH